MLGDKLSLFIFRSPVHSFSLAPHAKDTARDEGLGRGQDSNNKYIYKSL